MAGDDKKEVFRELLLEKTGKNSLELKNWVILNNHYHLLIEFSDGQVLPKFMKELHGASSFEIKKLPSIRVANEEQVILRQITPMEKRMEKRIEDFWRRLKPANTPGSVVADFSQRLPTYVIADFNPHNLKVVADLSPLIQKSIASNDYFMFKTLLLSTMPEIPFWHSYFSHIIRNEKDYFQHFNYITQNPVKHNLVKNPWGYKFSGIFTYGKEYVLDVLRKYPIIDFGGDYD